MPVTRNFHLLNLDSNGFVAFVVFAVSFVVASSSFSSGFAEIYSYLLTCHSQYDNRILVQI